MTAIVKNVRQIGNVLKANSATSDAWTPIEMRGRVAWDDLRFGFTQTKQGATQKPDFDFTNVGLLFPQNDAAEVVYMIGQIPHKYKLGTDIYPHIHWQQGEDKAVTWKLAYKWFKNGAAVPADFTTITTATGIFTYTTGNLLQISAWAAIDGSGVDTVSSILLMKLYREDNVYTGDVLAFEFDVHYQIDSQGSPLQYEKEE